MTALGLALMLAAAGCRKSPYDTNAIHGQRYPVGNVGPTGEQPINRGPVYSPHDFSNHATMIPLVDMTNHMGWMEDHESLKADTIYFDFDKSVVRAAEISKIQGVVNYLKSHPNAAVRVEGNCDERGTEEYNRSLGERRALAGREKIVSSGISASRVDTVSYGLDHPVDTGHNEAAWSKNRRDDFTVLTPPR